MHDKTELLRLARQAYDTRELRSLTSVVELLGSFGATPIDFARYRSELVDEFVDEKRVVGAWTIAHPVLLQGRASAEESELFSDDSDEPFDPNEYGAEYVEWTTWSHELNTLKRVIIILESSPRDPALLGNFRVYGAAQWLRETLWAASGIVPRDPGSPNERAKLFGDAFIFEGRERFAALPILD